MPSGIRLEMEERNESMVSRRVSACSAGIAPSTSPRREETSERSSTNSGLAIFLLYVDNTVRGELTDNGQGLGALGLRKSGGSNISGGRSGFGSLSGIKSGSGVGRVLTLQLGG